MMAAGIKDRVGTDSPKENPAPGDASLVDAAGREGEVRHLIGGRHGRQAVGLALRIEPVAVRGAPEADEFTIALVDAGGATLLALGPYPDEEVVATWRGLGRSSGLPLMLQRADGRLETPYPQIGRLELGAIRFRRRGGLPSGRRPRFLVRRKTARWPNRPAVHQGEPELFGARV